MADIFIAAFGVTFIAVLKVFIVIIAGGIMLRRQVVTDHHIRSLAVVTVNVFLPCLIFSKITASFHPWAFPTWWVLPLAAAAMACLGVVFGTLLFWGERRTKRDLIAVSAFHNAGYLVLPLGRMLFPEQWDHFALCCFLFILAYSPLIWSLGKVLIAPQAKGGGWRQFITPPFVANLAALLLVFSGLGQSVPGVISESVALLGEACVPVALFVLGGSVGAISLRVWPTLKDILRVVATRFILVPALVLGVLIVAKVGDTAPVIAAMLMLHASSAPAVALVLQVKRYGGDEQRVGGMMIITYLLAMFFLPFWQALFTCLS